jgi:hypothetical protein
MRTYVKSIYKSISILRQQLEKNIHMAQIRCSELIIPVLFSEQEETTIWYTVLCIGTGGLAIHCTVGTASALSSKTWG